MKNNFKSILFVITLTFATSALAQLVQVPIGSFNFLQNIELVTVKKYETVSTLSQTGKDRVLELIKNNWTCVQKLSNSTVCTIFSKNETLPFPVAEKIQNKYKNFKLMFSGEATIDKINDADFLKEYEIHQDVNFNGQTLPGYLLQVLKDGPTKIQLKNNLDKTYLIVLDEKLMVVHETVILTEKNKSTLYLVQVNLEKE